MGLIALWLGLALARETAPAAAPGWQVDRWTPADGLPLDHLNRVVVDGDGYVWVATFDGLSRFDGVGFETFRRDALPVLQSNRVVWLVVDAEGQLVFTDELGAVYRLDPAARPLQARVVLTQGARGLVRSGEVTWVYGDHAAWELVGDAAVQRLASPADEAHRADSAGADLDGGLIVQGRGALTRVDREGRSREIALPPKQEEGPPRWYDVAPAVDDAGRVWVVIGGALWVVEGAAPRRVPTVGAPCALWRSDDGQVRRSVEGGVWVGDAAQWTSEASCGEVGLSDGAEWVVRGGWLERDGQRLVAVGDPVPGMVRDGAGGVWVASHRGLLRVRPAAVTVLGGDGDRLPGAAAGAPLAEVWSEANDGARRATDALASDGQGGVWASVARRLVRLGPDGAPVPLPAALADAIPATVRAAPEGARLLSRTALISVGADVRTEPVPPGVEPAPGAWWGDAAGRTWLAHRDGLLQREAGGAWQEVRPLGEGLVDVRDAVTLADGRVVLLVGRQGLYVGAPDDLRRRDDLPSVDLRSAWVDGDGLWLGSEDAGLCRVTGDPLTGPVVCLGAARLGDHNVHQALDDGLGRLWLGTNRGLLVVTRAAVEAALAGEAGPLPVVRIDARDGLVTPEVNGGQWAALRDAAGRLWLPTMGGPAVVRPDVLPAPTPLAVQLQGLWADGEVVVVDGPVHLPQDTAELRARWSVPELVRPEQVQVRVRLDGVDRGWRTASREATWTSLPPGAHRLIVQARLAGDWGPPTVVEVSRAPTFVESRWFPAALMAGAAGATAAAAALWGRARRRREAALEDEVARRTAELVERNAAVSAAAAKLAAQSRQLAEVDAAKTRFVANLSHELRTPLMLVMAPLQELAEAPGPSREAARLAARNAERLRDLVEQLFDAVRLDAGRVPMRARRLDLAVFLAELVARFGPLALARGLTVELVREAGDGDAATRATAAPDPTEPWSLGQNAAGPGLGHAAAGPPRSFPVSAVPGAAVVADGVGSAPNAVGPSSVGPASSEAGLRPAPAGQSWSSPTVPRASDAVGAAPDRANDAANGFACWLWADPDLLDKIVSNLLGNALKFARSRVEVRVRGAASMATVVVADDGPGVPADVGDRVFERFFQADASDTRRADGAGIGLSLARELAELHGGELVLAPSATGARFELTLPRGAEHLDVTDIALDGPPAAPPEPAEFAGRRRVLVVEDHPELRAYLVSRLATELAVESVADGAAALARLRQGGVDLLLSDIMMPVMDGLALCRAVRAEPALASLPVVLLSAKGAAAEPEARAAGADAFIPKPVVGHELMAALRRHLPADPAPADDGALRRIEAVARSHLGDPSFNVERLAQKVGMSPRTLQRALNRLTGRSPVAWLQELRLEVGRDALRGGASVGEAAAAVGLSASYFTRLYGAWFGYPPREEG